MRISLLLQREPFGEILEQTLARFLESWTGHPHQVHWIAGRPDVDRLRRLGQQPWLCNIYLNAIFSPGADRRIFDPIRQEFARSLVWWRRPAQRLYVALAAAPHAARWLAQAGLGITPPLERPEQLLIVPGNHKIRLLDRANGRAYGMLKQGFTPIFMQRELAARQQAAELGLPTPPLETLADDGTWFCERYICGTPINRLAEPARVRRVVADVAGALRRLLQATAQEESLDEYAQRLAAHIEALLGASHLLDDAQKRGAAQAVSALSAEVRGQGAGVRGRITTALTHGDFQPANILADARGAWLVDWEYAGRRQAGYDALVFGLAARFPRGLAGRLSAFVACGWPADAPGGATDWLGLVMADRDARRLHATLFWLEELAMHLEENAQPPLTRPGEGLLILLRELALWQGQSRNG